jgi:hypothetical protein
MTAWEIYAGAVELVKSLAWPFVVVWGTWYLRVELKAAAKRLTEIGPSGAKFAPPEQQVAGTASDVAAALGEEEKSGSVPVAPNLQAFLGQVRSVISDDQLQPQIQRIRADLVLVAGDNPRDQVEALMYNSA